MTTSIQYIRHRYNVPAKIGAMVQYEGADYRIAWTKGTALLLRSELIVHPTDPSLNYIPSREIKMKNAEQLYSDLFIGITYLLPYDSFDPSSPLQTVEQLRAVIDERDQCIHDFEAIRNERNAIQSELDDALAEITRLKTRDKARELELDACWRVLSSEMGIDEAASAVSHTADIIDREIK